MGGPDLYDRLSFLWIKIWAASTGEVTALSTLIRQLLLTPSCGGRRPYRGENSGPGRHITESLNPMPELENSLG